MNSIVHNIEISKWKKYWIASLKLSIIIILTSPHAHILLDKEKVKNDIYCKKQISVNVSPFHPRLSSYKNSKLQNA